MIIIVTDKDLNVAHKHQRLDDMQVGSLWHYVPDPTADIVIYHGVHGAKVLKDRFGDVPEGVILKTHDDFNNLLGTLFSADRTRFELEEQRNEQRT